MKKTGRPSPWSGPTRAIRVPDHLADQLVAIAKQLDGDTNQGFVQNEKPRLITISDHKQTERYLLTPRSLTPEEDRLVEQALDDLWERVKGLKDDEKWALFANMVQATCKPISVEKNV